MTTATIKNFNTKKILQRTNKQRVQDVISTISEYGMSKRLLYSTYNELNPQNQIAYSSFYYKLNNATFTETEFNRINIVVKYIERNIVK